MKCPRCGKNIDDCETGTYINIHLHWSHGFRCFYSDHWSEEITMCKHCAKVRNLMEMSILIILPLLFILSLYINVKNDLNGELGKIGFTVWELIGKNWLNCFCISAILSFLIRWITFILDNIIFWIVRKFR